MNEKKKVQRKDRTFQKTLDELMESPRFKIALSLYEHDPMFLRAILTELYLETVTVVKSTLCKTYNNASSMTQQQMLPLLRSVNDFTTFNIYWSLSPLEVALYSADPKHQMSKEEKAELLEKVRLKFMESDKNI